MPGEWVKKLWGQSRELFRDETVEITEIIVVPGGFCSIHRHDRKDNTFIVLQGELEVSRYPGLQQPSVILRPDSEPFCIDPGVPHLFHAIESSRAIEVYRGRFGHAPELADIVRTKEGGVRKR